MEQRLQQIIGSHLYVNILSFLLIVLFTYTGVTKLAEPEVFRISLQLSPITHSFAGFLAWCIPITELLIVVLLFSPRILHYGMLASSLLLLMFALYILAMLVFVDDLPCSCGGIVSRLSWSQHLALNIILSILAFLAYAGMVKKNCKQGMPKTCERVG